MFHLRLTFGIQVERIEEKFGMIYLLHNIFVFIIGYLIYPAMSGCNELV